MSVIYKYPLAVTDHQVIQLPKGAKLLSVQTQNDYLCLWALVDPSQDAEPRHIAIVGPGHVLTAIDALTYIGTAQHFDGKLVWHVFEFDPTMGVGV